jgi:hypothetical protein
VQLNSKGGGLSVFFPFYGEEVIIMETFLEMLHEILRGMLRETGAYFFRKKVLENRKTTQRRRKQKGGSRK